MAMVESGRPRGKCRAADAAARSASSEIAASQQLSLPYLEQLFARLRRAGLGRARRAGQAAATAWRGRSDRALDRGDRRRRATSQFTPPVANPMKQAAFPMPRRRPVRCETHDLWAELGRQI